MTGELIARTHAFPFSTSKAPANLCSSASSGLLSASNGYTISIFGSAGEAIHTLPYFSTSGSASTISAMAWARDKADKAVLFASVSSAGSKTSIMSWSVDDDAVEQSSSTLTLPDDSGAVTQLLVSPDDRFIAAMCGLKVFIWRLTPPLSPETQESLPDHSIEKSGKQALCFAWADSGSVLAVSFGKNLILWEHLEATEGKPQRFHQILYERQESEISSLVFEPSGELLVSHFYLISPEST